MHRITNRFEHEANELRLYITTSSEPLYRKHIALETSLDARERKPSHAEVYACFRGLIDDGAKAYCAEYRGRYVSTFPEQARVLAARELTQVYLNGLRRNGSIKERYPETCDRTCWEVRSNEGLEGAFHTETDAKEYVTTLRTELATRSWVVPAPKAP